MACSDKSGWHSGDGPSCSISLASPDLNAAKLTPLESTLEPSVVISAKLLKVSTTELLLPPSVVSLAKRNWSSDAEKLFTVLSDKIKSSFFSVRRFLSNRTLSKSSVGIMERTERNQMSVMTAATLHVQYFRWGDRTMVKYLEQKMKLFLNP